MTASEILIAYNTGIITPIEASEKLRTLGLAISARTILYDYLIEYSQINLN